MTPDILPSTKPRRDDEAQLQRAIVSYLKLAARPNALWFAVPNGEKRSKATAAKLKSMGVLAGVGDLCFILATGVAAFMELKAGKNRQSKEQVAFEALCDANGAAYVVVTSFDQAVAILKSWGVVRGR